MHVEETEHLGLRKSKGVKDGARSQIDIRPKLDDELHADRPLADFITFGQSHAAIDVATHRANRPVSHDGQRSVNVHSRSKARFRIAALIHALIE